MRGTLHILALAFLVVAGGIAAGAWIAARVVALSPPPPAPSTQAAPSRPRPAPPAAPPRFVGYRVRNLPGALRTDNPFEPHWQGVPVLAVQMLPQNLAMPAVTEAAIPALQVQILSDGTRIAWRLQWNDAAPDGNVDTSRYTDAVALQFPLVDDAPITMGQPEGPVQIMQWKALWQKDIDVGFQDVQDLHPNFWSDLYWFAEGEFPFPIPAAFRDPRSLEWFIALQAGNPLAVFSRTQPVEELTAIGFGTLTHQAESATTAKGAWKDGRWSVVLSRPLRTADAQDYQFRPGVPGRVAFAVWDGAAGNVGGRKSYSMWNDFTVEP